MTKFVLHSKRVFSVICSKHRILSASWIQNEQLRHFSKEKLVQKGLPKKFPLPGVKHVVLIASGKGGVGKSAVAVNLANALYIKDKTKSVGLLDADVFGPSLPLMMNLYSRPELTSQNLLKPLNNYGIKCMSMGFLVDSESAFVWRGLMVMSAIEKLLRGVDWGTLDYLLIDLPPGTGDVQLSISQNIPVSGAIIVTTPQEVALMDARRGVTMFKKVDIAILGIVENMSSFSCCKCGHHNEIFGSDAITKFLKNEKTILSLGKIPLDIEFRKSCDIGHPIVISSPQTDVSKAFFAIADKLIELLPDPLVK